MYGLHAGSRQPNRMAGRDLMRSDPGNPSAV